MSSTAIERIESRLFKVPLAEVLTDAKHGDHSHFELITTTITLADGSSRQTLMPSGSGNGACFSNDEKAFEKARIQNIFLLLDAEKHLKCFEPDLLPTPWRRPRSQPRKGDPDATLFSSCLPCHRS